MVLSTVLLSSFEKYLFKSFAHFLTGLFVFLLLICQCSFYPEYRAFFWHICCKHFLPICGLPLYFLNDVLQRTKGSYFNWSLIYYFLLLWFVLSVCYLIKLCLPQICKKYSLMVSFRSFTVLLSFTFASIIHLESIFCVWYGLTINIHFFLTWTSCTICWKDSSFLTKLPWHLCQNNWPNTCGSIYELSNLFHWSICLYFH